MKKTLKKLRLRIVCISMAMMFVLMASVLVAVGWMNFAGERDNIYTALDNSLNMWHGPANKIFIGRGSVGVGSAGLDDGSISGDQSSGLSSDISGGLDEDFADISIEPVVEYRLDYVPVVRVVWNGIRYYVTGDQESVSIDDAVLSEAVDTAIAQPNDTGLIDKLGLYYKKLDEFGEIRMAFASSDPLLTKSTDFALMLTIIGLVTLLVLFFICWWLARLATRPVGDAWQRERRFIQDASHELKTPLTVILANNSLMRSELADEPPEKTKWLGSTDTEAQNMQNLIADMMDLTKSDELLDEATLKSVSNIADKTDKQIDLGGAVEGSVLQYESLMFEKELAVETALDKGISINVSQTDMDKILTILFDNVSKYATPATTVKIAVKSVPGTIWGRRKAELTIANHTTAVTDNDIKHLFDRFYRSEKTRSVSEDAGGYGIGLALAKRLCELNHGKISVDMTGGVICFKISFSF